MEIINISEAIEGKIKVLMDARDKLKASGNKKAVTSGEYDKALALAIIGLKNGKEYTFESEVISSPPATIMRDIAKGLCYQEAINRDVAEADYKSLITFIETVQAELNALQSLNRHLD